MGKSISLIAHTKDENQIEVIKAFMKALKIKFELKIEKDSNPMYSKKFLARLNKAEEERKEGKLIPINPENIWEAIS